MPALVRLSEVTKVYDTEGQHVTALSDISVEIRRGEFVALMGPSGCGKSTMLHIMGAMDRPTRGEAWIEDTPIHSLSEDDLTLIRRTEVGFVFQFFHLLPTLTVEENVALPLLLANGRAVDEGRVRELLETVGLTQRREAKPGQLSGGEMQRAALARAVVHAPSLLVADEPTGNLDSENGGIVLELLARLAEDGTAVVMATHSEAAAAYAGRRLYLRDGRLAS
jgi:putative ABC transport system ATP-binding protein